MTYFTAKEIDYLNDQKLGPLATLAPNIIRITLTQIIGWGIDTSPYNANSRKTTTP